ncbi:MAG: HD domain-containing protein [Candidatus Viridilinea halotolerans]|uniref:5'-deoxynucleotidase n=1 Tax=Candidatus Viridilinea halotolerans TaxID=2491704 RepID=A0A426TTP3_9CHLR|nr:MAG: HD domain-containing protein [Candidatus Viridilinea halotolerans]
MSNLHGRLAFIRAAEQLKDVLRSGRTAQGRQESSAEHSWRLALMALTFADLLAPIDLTKLLKLCILHDLGEALTGDVSAVAQIHQPPKAAEERAALQTLTASLPNALQAEFLALWDEYEAATSREAQSVKALDKLETIIQHNQGANSSDFDYAFNLEYGRRYTSADPLFVALRELVDAETQQRLATTRPAADAADGA